MTPIEKQILRNQQTIMRNLAFGSPELKKGGILNAALVRKIEETIKLFGEKSKEPCCEMPKNAIQNQSEERGERR